MMSIIDWFILAVYLLAILAIGLYFSRKAGRSTDDYFVAGRSLGWFLAGTSIVATTFSPDTPLIVSGISRSQGIWGNWFWLSSAIGQTATIFFFSKYWRRTNAKTDIEFITMRYDHSHTMHILRIAKVFYDGVLLNCIVMASVIMAMSKILTNMLNVVDLTAFTVPFWGALNWEQLIVIVLALISLLYSSLSGLYGVVYTELVQFIVAMSSSIILAGVVYFGVYSNHGISTTSLYENILTPDKLRFFPSLDSSFLSMFTFFVYFSMMWWYRAPGKGYFVQRMLATKSEKDSVLAYLWFNFCQYVLRPWPWMIIGLLSLYYFPNLTNPETSYPQMMLKFAPVGLKGLMIAVMMAAFMGTIDSHLNLGMSYLINDLYKPYLVKNKGERHYIRISRSFIIVFLAVAILIASKLPSLLGAYKYLAVVYSGTSTVMIARWYWWRVNLWSEISAIFSSFIIANYLQWQYPSYKGQDIFAVHLVISTLLVFIIWTGVTLLTSSKKPSLQLIEFYKKMRLPGPGWKTVQVLSECSSEPSELKTNLWGWIGSLIFIYSSMMGLGKLLLHSYVSAIVCIVMSCLGACILSKSLKKSGIFSSV